MSFNVVLFFNETISFMLVMNVSLAVRTKKKMAPCTSLVKTIGLSDLSPSPKRKKTR